MKTGLLWFDDDSRKKLEEKVLRAAAHYERKYGRAPDLCFVHPDALNNGNGNGKRGKRGEVKKAGEVEIHPVRTVLLHHFWLGVKEDSRASKSK